MKKEFIPYEQALELKKLGFNEECFGAYIDKILIIEDDWLYSTNQDTFIESSNFTAPLYQQAFRWFREKYGYVGGIRKLGATSNPYILGEFYKDEDNHFMIFGETYEDCELKSLKELIEIAKNK